MLLLLLVFIVGAVTVISSEALGLWILIRHLNRKIEREEIKAKAAASAPSSPLGDLNPALYEKQGDLWVLSPDKIPTKPEDKTAKGPRQTKDIVEVIPVRKYARIREHSLFLSESDGSCTEILLSGCTIITVSASSMPSRKWVKRYPIKVENKDSTIYKGFRSVYIYLETSWEKESWCKALRLASSNDEEKLLWFNTLNMKFHRYLATLNAGYPSIIKPSAGLSSDLINKSSKIENPSSKVRQFMKKLAKKASKTGQDYKVSSTSVTGLEERKTSERSVSVPDSNPASGLMKVSSKPQNVSFNETSVAPAISTSSESGSRSDLTGISNQDSDQNNLDEGTLCFNLLISRLFFDVNNNLDIRNSIRNRIQRTLSSMRLPSYIGEVTCTAVDLGSLPPRILSMRVLPSDMSEVCGLEIDLEYLNGIILDVVTRLEIRDLEFEGEETHLDEGGVGEVNSDLLEGFEDIGNHLNLSEEITSEIKPTDGDHSSDATYVNFADGNENYKSTTGASSQVSRWKSVLNSITKQVSEVPLSLRIKVSSLRGTVQLCLKSPPSDQMWFGFISMPDIEFNLESFVAERRFTSGRLALFLISRFKAAIRETLVLPNRESVIIPWMLAEKDDWVPRKVAPFLWSKSNLDSASNTLKREGSKSNQDSDSSTSKQGRPSIQPREASNTVDVGHRSPARSEVSESLGPSVLPSASMDESRLNDGSPLDLRAPLLKEFSLANEVAKPGIHLNSRSLGFEGGQSNNNLDDDTRMRRIGTRERMLGLGKKMGEKLEVKRRHIEEKGRNFVEKMRGP